MARLPLLRSLTNRIFIATVVLVVLAVGLTAVFVAERVTAEAEAELRKGLDEAAKAVERRGETLSASSLLTARLVADLPRLKAAILTGDGPTVLPLAHDYRSMVPQADLVAITDASGRVLAVDTPGTNDEAAVGGWPSVAAALGGADGIAYQAHPHGIRQVVSVPVTMGRTPAALAGTLSIGFLFDDAVAAEFKALTGSEITFAVDQVVLASTLPRAHWAVLAAGLTSASDARVQLGSDEFVVRAQRMRRHGDGSAGTTAGPTPVVIVARSRTERLRFLGTIRTVTAVTVLAAILAATVLSYALARTVTRPLAAITDTMRAVAATGDLTRKIPVRAGPWEDEDARVLATTFNGLIDAVARFEREAAQRERLSALGRLSSVVAHEVRNPLMIIKASVRALRATGAGEPVMTEALADIDGEVDRLNRLVNEVLDFSRPIMFELAPADINALCTGAARAVRAGEPDVAIALDLADGLPPITTDEERVRAVLVNAATNAVQAVRRARATGLAAGGPGPEPPPVVIATTATSGGGVRVTVRDAGPGIDPALMPRVFEPFVTTRRGGTGLGLAIARNVIEGLGGCIDLASQPGAGTVLTVELPAVPPTGPPAPLAP